MNKHVAALAVLLGVLVFVVSLQIRFLVGHAGDFTWPLHAARALLTGENPYLRQDLGPPALRPDVLLYPLPTVLVLVPFTPFPDSIALSLFLALSAALLGYVVQVHMPQALPFVLSAPFWTCILAGQWSILLTALLLIPLAAPLLVVKPTIAPTAIAFQQTPLAAAKVAGWMIVLCILSWPFLWSWPLDWLHNIPQAAYQRIIIAATFPGVFILLAALRWKNPMARVLLALALFPQFPNFYDAVALTLIPHTRRMGVLFAALSWVLFVGGRLLEQQTFATILLYLLALVFVFLTPVDTPSH